MDRDRGGDALLPYVLGRQFLAGLYRALGPAVVSAALRELFESGWGTDRGPTEEAIYQAFLQHTPLAQRDAFRVWYSCLHGRAIPGWIPPAQLPGAAASREVLAALYHVTNGPGWTNDANWLSDAPLDQWHGVTVDCDGAVLGLSLEDNQLSGPIPAALGRLSQLTRLDLTGNRLRGPIPPELGDLAQLERLGLSRNRLTGSIPVELGRLANLQSLNLSENRLSGPIPPELGTLAQLTALYLWDNLLTGCVLSALGALPQHDLTVLGLPFCAAP